MIIEVTVSHFLVPEPPYAGETPFSQIPTVDSDNSLPEMCPRHDAGT